MNIPLRNISRYRKYLFLLRRALRRKPVLLFRLAWNYFRLLVLRRKIVRKVEIGVCFECQCKCGKCSSEHMRRSKKEKLTPAEIGRVFADILEHFFTNGFQWQMGIFLETGAKTFFSVKSHFFIGCFKNSVGDKTNPVLWN